MLMNNSTVVLPADIKAKHTIELRKSSSRKLSERTENNMNQLIDYAVKKKKDRGWSIDIENSNWLRYPEKEDNTYYYRIILNVICDQEKPELISNNEFNAIVKIIDIQVNKQNIRWEIGLIDGQPPSEMDLKAVQRNVEYVDVQMPDNWDKFFSHIFDRDKQIKIVQKAICAAIESEFNNRFHIALIGDPASGKTEILRSVKKALGAATCIDFDATSTTQAGAIKELGQRESMPRIMMVEEIEKAEENSLRWMLGIMDQRAEINKRVGRGQNIEQEAKMLTFATVNDYPRFLSMNAKALQSRFSFHLYCPDLSRDILKKILEREVARIKNSSRSWVGYALDYSDETGIKDPRKLIAVCLAGGNDLIKGDFQKWLKGCNPAEYLEKCLSGK